MMNHYVPHFEIDDDNDDDYSFPSLPDLKRPKKSSFGNEEMMELMWQNGQVIVQSQIQKSHIGESTIPSHREIRFEDEEERNQQQQLFIHEDEMASWLHLPLQQHSNSVYSDLYTPFAPDTATPSADACVSDASLAEVRPPPLPPTKYRNFEHLSRIKSGPSISTKSAARESTVVESHDNAGTVSGGKNISCGSMSRNPAAGTSLANCEVTVTSSYPVGSVARASTSVEPFKEWLLEPIADRKRKGRVDDNAGDVVFEYGDAKKQLYGTTSTRKSRVAEVHNLSERRRRDRINEKMKALQELIPHSNKTDKASMLDEAIEYLKSLQMQLQMMSMGRCMVPVMFPGFQHYMPPMDMGMGMNRPVMVPLQNPAAAHLSPILPMPAAFHNPAVHGPGPSRIQPTNQLDPALNSLASQNPNQAQIPSFSNPYQQYLGHHQGIVPLPKNNAMMHHSTSKPGGSREAGNPDNHQPG